MQSKRMGAHPSSANTSEILLHEEKLSWKANWKLVEGLL